MAVDPEAAAADPSRDPAVFAGYRERFSWAAAGARYRAQLEELWGQRQELAGRLKWRADTMGGWCPPGVDGGGWGARRRRLRPRGNTNDSRLVLAYYLLCGLAVGRVVPGGGS